MDKEIFKNLADYWLVSENIKDLYLSEGSIVNLLDYERVLDELDLYAFKNWHLGELVQGPDISRYHVNCIFMWPEKLMPDPRGAKRLLPFDCKVKFKKTRIKIPIKIEDPDDFIPGTHKARLIEKPVWLVEISIPKSLMSDIKTGSIELEDESVDLEDLEKSYDEDLQQQEYRQDQNNAPRGPSTPAQPAAPLTPGVSNAPTV